MVDDCKQVSDFARNGSRDESGLGMMSVSDDKSQTIPAPKKEASPKNKGASGADPSKAEEGGEKIADSPTGYSRGEGQKPVSKAYRDNWDAIFGKKKRR